MRQPCCEKERINKGAWSKQEDQKLIDYIKVNGEGCWRSLPKAAGLHRCGKSCRLRWINYLRPDIKRGNFAQDEEDLIIKLHALLGNRWSLIAGRLPGRTDNEVKNYWNSHIRKKLIRMGIDPNNHKPHQHLLLPLSTTPNIENVSLPRPVSPQASQITQSSSSMDEDEEESKPPLQYNSKCNDIVIKSDMDQVSGGMDLVISDQPMAIVTHVASSVVVEQDETETSQQLLPCVAADLNLDLSIAVPVLQKRPCEDNEKGRFDCLSAKVEVLLAADNAIGSEVEPSPTLLLFR